MKVLHFNTSGSGGAAKACIRIHKGLLKQNINSELMLDYDLPVNTDKVSLLKERYNGGGYRQVFFYELCTLFGKVHKKYLERKHEFNETYFSFNTLQHDITKCDLYREADIVHLHWVAHFFNLKRFFDKNKKPVVWTQHDMAPSMPGNHYPLTAQEKINNSKLLIKYKHAKKEYLSRQKIMIVSTTDYVNNYTKANGVLNSKLFTKIHYGLDTDIYKYRSQKLCRELLGLPEKARILLFAAQNLKNKRKGMQLFIRSLKKIKCDNLFIIAVGAHGDDNLFGNIPSRSFGYIEDEFLMSIIFSSADVFITPAIYEAFGQTTIESLCSGTPVIGFETGILPEILEHGITSFLAKEKSADGLFKCIQMALSLDFDKQQISESAHHLFNESIQAKKYIDLYKSLLI